jgi:hypothetical protein
MSIAVRDFLKARRDRALGSIMGYMEREVFPSLQPQERVAVRSVVLDALNSYHDSVLDLVKADSGSIRNDELLAMLTRVEQHLRAR